MPFISTVLTWMPFISTVVFLVRILNNAIYLYQVRCHLSRPGAGAGLPAELDAIQLDRCHLSVPRCPGSCAPKDFQICNLFLPDPMPFISSDAIYLYRDSHI